jgi:hypothetical protein
MRTILMVLLCLFVSAEPVARAETDSRFVGQRGLIDAQVARFASEPPGAARVFFVGFAGYGEERVFAEEIKLAAKVVGEKYGSATRSLLLINDRRDLNTWPMATAASLRYALKAVARAMNPEQDVLFLALSSHGSRDATIAVSNEGMAPQSLSADELADALSESGIRWKVIVVSACFSGTFIKPLADNHTIVITAAARNRASFGCSDTRRLTYFGEAFYEDALPGAESLRTAFEATRKEIRKREKDEGQTPSNPRSYFGPMMETKLEAIKGDIPIFRREK